MLKGFAHICPPRSSSLPDSLAHKMQETELSWSAVEFFTWCIRGAAGWTASPTVLMTAYSLPVPSQHLRELVVGLQQLSWKRRETTFDGRNWICYLTVGSKWKLIAPLGRSNFVPLPKHSLSFQAEILGSTCVSIPSRKGVLHFGNELKW